MDSILYGNYTLYYSTTLYYCSQSSRGKPTHLMKTFEF